MVTRQGSLAVDFTGALAALGLISLIAVGASVEIRNQAKQERRAAALETAQNLLARARRDGKIPETAGWEISRATLPGGVVELRVRSQDVSLATFLPEEGGHE